MLRKLFVVAAIGLLPALAIAQPKGDEWDFTLSASGASTNDFDANAIGANFTVGKYLTKDLEVALRQSLSWADGGSGGSSWSGSTAVAVDYHFDLDAWRPFVGAAIGYSYGDVGDDSWIAALEVGVKYYVNQSTYIWGMVQYQFLLEDSFGDGNWVYTVGIGFIK